jgi:hypothetical protein
VIYKKGGIMNIVIKTVCIAVGLLVGAQIQAYLFTFNNNTIRDLVVKIKVRNIPEQSLELPAGEKGEKNFEQVGYAGCAEYISLRKPDGQVVKPKLVMVDEDKYGIFTYKKEMQEAIDLDELLEPGTYTGVVVFDTTGVCADTTLDVFMDINGDLFLVGKSKSVK